MGYIIHETTMKGVCLSSTLVPMQMDPSMDILGTQTAQKNGNLGPFSTNFEREVRHLRHPFPTATAEFLAQTLCDCASYP